MSRLVIIFIHSCGWGLMMPQIEFGLAEVSEYLHPEGIFNAHISGSFFWQVIKTRQFGLL